MRKLSDAARKQIRTLLEAPDTDGNGIILRGLAEGMPASKQAKITGIPLQDVYRARHKWLEVLAVLVGGKKNLWEVSQRSTPALTTGEMADLLGLWPSEMRAAMKSGTLPLPRRRRNRYVWDPETVAIWRSAFKKEGEKENVQGD